MLLISENGNIAMEEGNLQEYFDIKSSRNDESLPSTRASKVCFLPWSYLLALSSFISSSYILVYISNILKSCYIIWQKEGDVTVVDIRNVPSDFHARYKAQERT